MQGRHVIVFCNLKPNKIRGEVSQGMVMCAASEDGKVEIIDPPADAVAGDRITVEGFSGWSCYISKLMTFILIFSLWNLRLAYQLLSD